MELTEQMEDLLKQAETEKSHFYVANILRKAICEIETLRMEIVRLHLKGNIKVNPKVCWACGYEKLSAECRASHGKL